MARSDHNTEKGKQLVYLRDFSTNFERNPITGFLATHTNESDAKILIRNLVLTIVEERPYQPSVGSKIFNQEFEPGNQITFQILKDLITQTIKNNLPFIRVLGVSLRDDSDQNGMTVTVTFSLSNNVNPVMVDIALKQVR